MKVKVIYENQLNHDRYSPFIDEFEIENLKLIIQKGTLNYNFTITIIYTLEFVRFDPIILNNEIIPVARYKIIGVTERKVHRMVNMSV